MTVPDNFAEQPVIRVDQRADRDGVKWTRTGNLKPWRGMGGIDLTETELDERGPLTDTSYDVTYRAEHMPVGTIVSAVDLIIRRRPLATIGLPWKSRGGTRYEHAEIDLLVANGATATLCGTCAQGGACNPHDEFAPVTRPNSDGERDA